MAFADHTKSTAASESGLLIEYTRFLMHIFLADSGQTSY